MPAPSSTVINMSVLRDVHDGATLHRQHRRRPCRSYLLSSTTWRIATPTPTLDNADLCSVHRWAWYCKDPACPKYWSAWSCKSNFWLHLYKTAVHRADARTYTRVGRRKLAREWRVETDWEMKELKQPSLLRNKLVLRRATSRPKGERTFRRDMLSSCSQDRYIWWGRINS